MADKALPHVGVAVLCEHVLTEKDGVHSLVRIFDGIDVEVTGEKQTAASIEPIPLTGLILLKSDQAVGTYRLRLRGHSPSGQVIDLMGGEKEVTLNGGAHGVTLTLNFVLHPDVAGLYWFDLLADDQLLTRIPLRLSVTQRLR